MINQVDIIAEIRDLINDLDTERQKITSIEILKDVLNDLSPLNGQPVDRVRWVDLDDVQANDYNPNSVANKEMSLLYTSISHDGYTQPVVTIYDEEINDRMASTVRHNRARGKHSVDGMANMVFSMLENGWEDSAICNELGMETEELIRLKHITGFSKLFKNHEFKKAWETKRQIQIKKAYKENESNSNSN